MVASTTFRLFTPSCLSPAVRRGGVSARIISSFLVSLFSIVCFLIKPRAPPSLAVRGTEAEDSRLTSKVDGEHHKAADAEHPDDDPEAGEEEALGVRPTAHLVAASHLHLSRGVRPGPPGPGGRPPRCSLPPSSPRPAPVAAPRPPAAVATSIAGGPSSPVSHDGEDSFSYNYCHPTPPPTPPSSGSPV